MTAACSDFREQILQSSAASALDDPDPGVAVSRVLLLLQPAELSDSDFCTALRPRHTGL